MSKVEIFHDILRRCADQAQAQAEREQQEARLEASRPSFGLLPVRRERRRRPDFHELAVIDGGRKGRSKD